MQKFYNPIGIIDIEDVGVQWEDIYRLINGILIYFHYFSLMCQYI